MKNKKYKKKHVVSYCFDVFLEDIFFLELIDDLITCFLMVVAKTKQKCFFELCDVFVFSEESLMPEHVDFMVDVFNDLFKFVELLVHEDFGFKWYFFF